MSLIEQVRHVDEELRFAEPHRRLFLDQVAYHEAVHTGQLLRQLRIARCPRPDVWD